jgi:hypothetical protein
MREIISRLRRGRLLPADELLIFTSFASFLAISNEVVGTRVQAERTEYTIFDTSWPIKPSDYPCLLREEDRNLSFQISDIITIFAMM